MKYALRALWASKIAPFLTRFNRHTICWSGVVLAFVSLGAIGGKEQLDLWATTHLGGVGSVVTAFVDGAATVGLVIVWPAIIAAALGRPPNIPGSPKPP
jgi:hypothetical protein